MFLFCPFVYVLRFLLPNLLSFSYGFNRLKVGPTQLIVITDPTIIRETFHGLDSPVLLRFISETFYQV